MCARKHSAENTNVDKPEVMDQAPQHPLSAMGGAIVALVVAATVGGWVLATHAPSGVKRDAIARPSALASVHRSPDVEATVRATSAPRSTATTGAVEAVDAPWGELPWPTATRPAVATLTVYIVDTADEAAFLRASYADASMIASITGEPPRTEIIVVVAAARDALAVARDALAAGTDHAQPEGRPVQIIDLRGRPDP